MKAHGSDSYSCPDGFNACNSSFLDEDDLVEYAICLPGYMSVEEECPITSFAFTLAGMDEAQAAKYQQAKSTSSSLETPQFFFSKSVPNHAIDEVRVGSNAPCWNN